ALHAFLQSAALDSAASASGGTSAEAVQGADSVSDRALAERAEGFAPLQRILIVNDEPHLRCICRYTLQSEEIHCDEAANGVLALQAVHARPYDLVLLDID